MQWKSERSEEHKAEIRVQFTIPGLETGMIFFKILHFPELGSHMTTCGLCYLALCSVDGCVDGIHLRFHYELALSCINREFRNLNF